MKKRSYESEAQDEAWRKNFLWKPLLEHFSSWTYERIPKQQYWFNDIIPAVGTYLCKITNDFITSAVYDYCC